MNVAARATKEPKLVAIFSHPRAMRLKRLIFPMVCSMRARPLQRALAKRFWPVFRGLSVWNDGQGASLPGELAVCGAVVALVSDDDAGPDIRPKVHQGLEMGTVGSLAAGQVERDRQAVEVRFQVDFGAEAAARAPKGLTVLPPFAPAAETCARVTVESNI